MHAASPRTNGYAPTSKKLVYEARNEENKRENNGSYDRVDSE